MTWPPQSHDLNPFQIVWDELDCRVKEKQPTNAQHTVCGNSFKTVRKAFQMLGCGCVLLSCLLTVTLFHCSVDSLRLTQESPEYLDPVVLEESGLQARSSEQKAAGALTAKLLLLDHLDRLENDVIETKMKRSFPGSNTPLDRLSISTMDPKGSKQRKVVELPRRRVSVPIDRIGVGRLPSSRG
ncbi:osteocrin isoform X1 [Oncorhynchus clarkii lewisi]